MNLAIYELLAWSLDFEGTIGINVGQTRGRDWPSYHPIVKIGTCSKEHLIHFQRRVGIGYVNPNPRITSGNPSYEWLLRREEMDLHLSHILPFLFLKAEQAQVVIALLELKSIHYRNGQNYPHEIQLQMGSLYKEARRLNERVIQSVTEEEAFYRLLRRH